MYISALSNLWACPSSQAPTDTPYSPDSDAADVGSAAHDGLAEVPHGREPDIPAIARHHSVPEKEVDILVGFGRQAWTEIKHDFPAPMTEHRLRSDVLDLSGRADVFSLDDGDIAIVDWKSNRERDDVRAQLAGYAACSTEMYGLDPANRVRIYTVWLRLGIIDVETLWTADIEHFQRELKYKRRSIGQAYAPGDACTYCRRQLECKALQLYLHQASVTLVGTSPTGGLATTVDLPLLYTQSRALKKALGRYEEALKMLLRAGPQSDGRGGTLELETQIREDIDPREAWPVLTDAGFTEDDLAHCTSIKSGACMDTIAAKASDGQKGAARLALKNALRDAGAMKVRSFQQIKRTKGTK